MGTIALAKDRAAVRNLVRGFNVGLLAGLGWT